MEKFKWGPTFIKVNQELLERYYVCEDSAAIIEVQSDWLSVQSQPRRDRSLMSMPSSSDEEEEEEERHGSIRSESDTESETLERNLEAEKQLEREVGQKRKEEQQKKLKEGLQQKFDEFVLSEPQFENEIEQKLDDLFLSENEGGNRGKNVYK